MAPAADHQNASPKSPSSSVVEVLELCRISPPASNNNNTTTFPLTHFDIQWFHTAPVERLFFYALPPQNSTPSFFNSVILPTLKLSLSAALSHFLPLAASLVWPSHSSTPFLLYSPSSSSTGSSVPLTVAQSSADFNHLSSDIGEARDATSSHPYVPVFPSSDSDASVLALQVTLFPNQGFCLGISTHHAAFDGKSATLFVNAWAHLSKTSSTSLPEQLTPFLDRSVVQDPEGLGTRYLQYRTQLHAGPRSLKLRAPPFAAASGLVRATFLLSQERIKTLREKAMTTTKTTSSINNDNHDRNNSIRLSSFVLAFAHAIVCMVKAKRPELAEVVHFGFLADGRARLDPPLPGNYLGNCVISRSGLMEVGPLLAEGGGGVGFAAERISGMIDDLEEKVLSGAMDRMLSFRSHLEASRGVFIAVAGSPKFHVYDADFGWGKPKYVEVKSIDRTGAISLAECRDGSRGIEVGLALTRPQMDIFRSAFDD